MKNKLVAILCGLLMGIVPANRVSSGLIGEIVGVIGKLLFVTLGLRVIYNKLCEEVRVTASEFKGWSEDDFKKCSGMKIHVISDYGVVLGHKYWQIVCDKLNLKCVKNCEDLKKYFNVDIGNVFSDDKHSASFWCPCAKLSLVGFGCIPDIVCGLYDICDNIKLNKDIEKCKREIEKYQKIHENNTRKKGKLDIKNENGSSYENKK